MTDTSDAAAPTEPTEPTAQKPSTSPLDFLVVVLVAAGAVLLLAGVLYAFTAASDQNITGNQKYRMIAQAASPQVALLLLAGVVLAIHERGRPAAERRFVAAGPAVVVGTVAAMVTVLLALNGVVVDITQKSVAPISAGIRFSNILGRLVTVLLAGFALALAALAPPAGKKRGGREVYSAGPTRPPAVEPDADEPAAP